MTDLYHDEEKMSIS